MADTELLPCPFCRNADLCAEMGSTPSPGDYIMCDGPDGCGAMISRVDTPDDDLIGAWNRRATPPSPSTAPEVYERAAFEAWIADAQTPHIEGEEWPVIEVKKAWLVWQAALASRPAEASLKPMRERENAESLQRARPAEVGDEGLPGLPESKFCAWLQNGQVVNAFTHGVGEKARWDHDGHWASKGYDRAPLYTAEQYRQGQRDAVAADRARRGDEVLPAVLFDGHAVCCEILRTLGPGHGHNHGTVSATLDAVVRLMRAAPAERAQ